MAPIIVPHNKDGDSWRVHAMHCQECRPIYERQQMVACIVLIPLAAILFVMCIVVTYNMFKNFRKF